MANPFTVVTQHCDYYVTITAVISEQLMHAILKLSFDILRIITVHYALHPGYSQLTIDSWIKHISIFERESVCVCVFM